MNRGTGEEEEGAGGAPALSVLFLVVVERHRRRRLFSRRDRRRRRRRRRGREQELRRGREGPAPAPDRFFSFICMSSPCFPAADAAVAAPARGAGEDARPERREGGRGRCCFRRFVAAVAAVVGDGRQPRVEGPGASSSSTLPFLLLLVIFGVLLPARGQRGASRRSRLFCCCCAFFLKQNKWFLRWSVEKRVEDRVVVGFAIERRNASLSLPRLGAPGAPTAILHA